MSSILLVNPFAQPSLPPPQLSGPENRNAQSNDAVTPTRDSGNANASENSTSNSGSESGQNKRAGARNRAPALFRLINAPLPDRPTNATSSSVVNAQTNEDIEQDAPTLSLIDDNSAPQGALELTDFTKFVDKKMPDPLPTSPFLKKLSEGD